MNQTTHSEEDIIKLFFAQQAARLSSLAGASMFVGPVVLLLSTNTLAEQDATGINYEKDSTNIRTLTFNNVRNARFCELFFIKLKGDMKELHVYNPTGNE
jgi:hypothetical protein